MYSFDSRIRYSETDVNEKLSLTALLDYYQDCSVFQSDDLGVGLDYLKPKHLAWVLNSWQIDIFRYPDEGEKVRIGTIPYLIKDPLGYRNFFMDDEKGNRLSVAHTVWTLLDMEHGVPVKAPKEIMEAYVVEPKLDMEYLPRKIKAEGEGKALEPVVVAKHHLDGNHHVNNGQYVRIALDLISEEIIPKRLRAEYKAQARLGDIIYPVYNKKEGIHMISLNNESGKPYSIVEFSV